MSNPTFGGTKPRVLRTVEAATKISPAIDVRAT